VVSTCMPRGFGWCLHRHVPRADCAARGSRRPGAVRAGHPSDRAPRSPRRARDGAGPDEGRNRCSSVAVVIRGHHQSSSVAISRHHQSPSSVDVISRHRGSTHLPSSVVISRHQGRSHLPTRRARLRLRPHRPLPRHILLPLLHGRRRSLVELERALARAREQIENALDPARVTDAHTGRRGLACERT
jgi:hypothetical protein